MERINRTIESFKRNGYSVSYFEDHNQAADYLDSQIDGKVVGFGDSMTLAAMDMYNRLSSHNTVHDPATAKDNDEFIEIAKKALLTEIYLVSANAITETGEMVNIDGTGNRVAGSLFGHKKVYFVIGTNKICPTIQDAIDRARNVAAPLDAIKCKCDTPCAVKGDKCYDCRSKDRICNVIAIYANKMMDTDDMEIVLINEELGF